MDLPSAGALLELLGDGRNPESVGVFAANPVVFVQLDGDPRLDRLCIRLRDLPCVSVGVATGGWPPSQTVVGGGVPAHFHLDILMTQEDDPPMPWVGCPDLDKAVSVVFEAVNASPTAAVTLVQLLRLTEALGSSDAVVAESLAYSTLQSGDHHRVWLRSRPVRAPRHHSGPAVSVVRSGSVLRVELRRPEVRNALDVQMRDELVVAFELAAADSTLQVVVSGAGPAFCSGGDLQEFGGNDDPAQAHLIRTTRSAARALLDIASRTTFLLHGACVGAGIELAAFGRRVVAEPGTRISLPEVGMGLIPGAGGTVSLPRRIGRQRTAYLAITGQAVSAATALAWGLVDEVSPFHAESSSRCL